MREYGSSNTEQCGRQMPHTTTSAISRGAPAILCRQQCNHGSKVGGHCWWSGEETIFILFFSLEMECFGACGVFVRRHAYRMERK